MLDKLKAHARNWGAHVHVLASGAIASAVTGAGQAATQVGLDPVKMADWAAQDWHRLKTSMLIGAALGVFYRARKSPYPSQPPQSPAGGQ